MSGDAQLLWYGERGIVNSLATQLAVSGVDAVKQFLNCINWGDANRNDWISEINSVKMLVEIGLGQFGDPDLILVCQTPQDIFPVFIEAKVTPYLFSAGKGGASRIHRQLTLKWRFANALIRSRESSHISESKNMLSNYRQSVEHSDLIETKEDPRRLMKRSVLELCRQAGLFNADLDNFRFVAWTPDCRPFFASREFSTSGYQPRFLRSDGSEDWSYTQARLGWLGYDSLTDLVDHSFHQARVTMIPKTPAAEIQTAEASIPSITSYNIQEKSSDRIKAQLRQLEVIVEEYFPRCVKRYSGSSSVALQSPDSTSSSQKVLVKFVPQNPGPDESITFGISTSLGRTRWNEFDFEGPFLFTAQPFYTKSISSDDGGYEFVRGALEELKEIIDADINDDEP